MVLAMKLFRLSSQSLLKNKGYLCNSARYITDNKPLPWNYLWEPGEHKKEDHDKIAEKYHLHPKDYKPYPEEMLMGDYPNLPMVGPAAKDPYYPYDIPALKKNYHETIHHQFAMMTEDHFDFGKTHRISLGAGTLIFFAVMAGCAILYIGLEPYYSFLPIMEKQYPYKGKVYYTFELNEK